MTNAELISDARTAQKAVFLVASRAAAQDLSRIIGGLVDALEAAAPVEYESEAPERHTRVEADVWPIDCIYGDCEHVPEADVDAERPYKACPSSKAVVCQECSEWNSESEGGIESWPCENQALQEWMALGGPERRSDDMCEAFLRGWRERDRWSEDS